MDFVFSLREQKINVIENYSLKNKVTFEIGGFARYFVSIRNIEELKKVILTCKKFNIQYKILGKGSNLLVSDNGYNGAIISLSDMNKIYIDNTNIKAMAGVSLSLTSNYAYKNCLSGFEPFSCIPASIGGAIYMNVGCFRYTICDIVESVDVLKNEKIITLKNSDCNFSYRDSIFRHNNDIIVSVNFKLKKENIDIIKNNILLYKKIRFEHQPIGKSCGSVFRNPIGYSAGKLIESCGLKGYRIGDAYISNEHANFIINNGNATSKDVVAIIKEVKKKVKKLFNIDLKEEVEYLGDFDDIIK